MTLEELEALRLRVDDPSIGPEEAAHADGVYVSALVNEAPALLEELRLAREVVAAARALGNATSWRVNDMAHLFEAQEAYDRREVKSGKEAK